MNAKIVMTLLIGLGFIACYTPIHVKKTSGIGKKWEDGVPFYLPDQVRREFVLTKLESNGAVIGVAPADCEAIEDAEYVAVADLGQLYLIRSNDFFFGQNTFGVTLDKGMLASVNSVRDPQVDEMISAVAGAVSTVAGMGAPKAGPPRDVPPKLPDCNAGKRYKTPLP